MEEFSAAWTPKVKNRRMLPSPPTSASGGWNLSSSKVNAESNNKAKTQSAFLDEAEKTNNTIYFDAHSTLQSNSQATSNILNRIPSMYCLITMVYESGSTGQGGLVEKVIIDQESLGCLLNTLVPGSFRSISSIDFKSLDAITIKPKGVYGSRPEIAKFLLDQGILDANVARMLSQPDHNAPSTNLRSGLYMVLSPKHGADKNSSHDAFLVYWPEEATWQDDAEPTVQRNRVTFMRYLTQLSDQIIALISKDQANAFVWESGSLGLDTSIEDEDEDDERMFAFEVQKSEDQEENVIASPGFKVDIPQDKFARKNVELVGGETSIGFLVSSLEPARVASKENEGIQNGMSLKNLLSDKRHNIFLGHLNNAQLQLPLNTGLPERYPDRFAAYQADCTMIENERTQSLNENFHNIQSQMGKERPQIEQAVRDVWKAHSSKFESYVGTGKSSQDRKYSSNADRYACINSLGHEYTSKPLVHIPSNLFQDLKARITLIQAGLEAEERTREEQVGLIQKILTEPLDDLKDLESSKKGWGDQLKSWGSYLLGTDNQDKDPGTMSNESKDSAEIDDLNFLRQLDQVVENYPALRDARQRTLDALREYLANTERSFVERETRKAITSITKLHGDLSKEAIDSKLNKKRSELWNKFWEDIRNAMALQPKGPLIIRIDHIERVDRRGYRSKDPAYRVRTTHTVLHSKKMQYSFYPLNLRKVDIERLGEDAFVPQPQVRWDEAAFTFSLEEGYSLEFIQVMHDRCLVVVASTEKIFIYMNEFSQIGGAINLKHSKTTWHRTRLGSRPIYSYDEITRTFALCHGDEEPHLSWYVFDRRFSVLKASRTIPLIGWHTTPNIQSMCFVTGSTQLCVIDQSGFARILSLDSEQFGPAHVQLKPSFGNAFSAPDGSCLFVAIDDSETGKTELCAYHWASFGTRTEGFRPARLAPKSNYRVVSFDNRGGCYLVTLSQSQPHILSSVALHVKQKSAKFDFKAQGSRSKPQTQKTVNNCLIDAHMEVWLRFPVVSAITRNTLSGSSRQSRSIMLISEGEVERAMSYFSKLIGIFERTTGKPTDGKLLSIAVLTSSKTSRFTQHGTQSSSFRFGGYLVELICLIPIQLAVTQENNFIPLKDGVLNAAFERELLGADVPTIISSLSLGWYESIFHSYQATKPVRVVSSMGEQSVGKSYCLNHLADTSFAGSAMRTTEGVWLSCTPTEDYLLVALDFEGVQSIERSAQEDTLLVLFNAAISNMIIFRNNFAISRSISSMFKSFQSSATVLDPDLNPGLFNSVLAIVIKDVIGSDTKDVVREFSDELQAIVEEEQGRNFITRLHRSRINIIPWPVIKSRKFYTLFSGVRDTLEQQPVTYGGGALFLHTLKTLMAKIKANDWGALDQNLATHRARQLTQLLPGALSHGAMEIGPDSWGPLKVLDTDQEVQSYSDDVFWVPNNQEIAEPGPHSADQCLRVLIQKHSKYPTTRNEIPENQFLDSLQTLLNYQFERRVEQVREWVSTNVIRFPQDNQDIRDLFQFFENVTLSARAAIRICSSKCSLCHLLCLQSHRHMGDHDCGTDHKCTHPCSVDNGHPSVARCGIPSGHIGRHLCEPTKHTCGKPCSLWTRGGCHLVCVKEIDHIHPDEHLCSARLHTCGQPCDLQTVTQGETETPGSICFGICEIPWDQEHERHACGNSKSCPFKCLLCPRLCSSPDHLHGLDPDSVHLCGQEHACTKLCETPGICQIETQPAAIVERFTGRYEQFQYTRYSQEKRRLPCAIPIAPGKLVHDGQHVHSIGAIVFHYCDVQCPHCEYYCTLPIGHPQREHETSHGSMIQTRWLLDGPTSTTSYELQDHKYGSGDQGSTVLCSMLCSQQGRHAHVDYCRREDGGKGTCGGDELQHIDARVGPNTKLPKDWISHRLYWARSGFKDPYSRNEQAEFAKCDSHCAGHEHKATSSTPADPSYCTMPIFHKPISSITKLKKGYVSMDGHIFECNNPFQDSRNYHIVFVIDNSTSMKCTDQGPLENTPITAALKSSCNNRYGAVISALYTFWKSRETPNNSSTSQHIARTDAYSVLTFSDKVTCHTSNDFSSTPEQLIKCLLPQKASYGTNFESAIRGASAVIEQNWDTTRTPVVILLSDGEGSISDDSILRLCQRCVKFKMPLAFYAISFSSYRHIPSLERMAQIVAEVYKAAQANQRPSKSTKKIPCEYMDVNGALELANKFLVISKSLQKPRAALIGSRNNRLKLLANDGVGKELEG